MRNTQKDIDSFVKKFGYILPDEYILFLSKYGFGRIHESMNGEIEMGYDNMFLATREIGEILERESFDWQVYPDFIQENEVPFFRLGQESVLVFRLGSSSKSAVYFPYLDERYADNFEDFLEKLAKNVTFYVDIDDET